LEIIGFLDAIIENLHTKRVGFTGFDEKGVKFVKWSGISKGTTILPMILCFWMTVSSACNHPVEGFLEQQTALQRSATALSWTVTPSMTERPSATWTHGPTETASPSETPTLLPETRHIESGTNSKSVGYSFSFLLPANWGVYTSEEGNPHFIGCPDFPVHIPCYIQWTPDNGDGKSLNGYAQDLMQRLPLENTARSLTVLSSSNFATNESTTEAFLIHAKYLYVGDSIKWDLYIFKKDNKIVRGTYSRRMYMDESADADVDRMMKSFRFE
jgi:hypothetical protein